MIRLEKQLEILNNVRENIRNVVKQAENNHFVYPNIFLGKGSNLIIVDKIDDSAWKQLDNHHVLMSFSPI